MELPDTPELAALVERGCTADQVRRLIVTAHEAGHAVAYWHYGHRVVRVNVTGCRLDVGGGEYRDVGGCVSVNRSAEDPTADAVVTLSGMAGVTMAGLGGLGAFGIGGDLAMFDTLGLGDDWTPYADTALDILKRHEPTFATLTTRLLREGDMDAPECDRYSGLDLGTCPPGWPRRNESVEVSA